MNLTDRLAARARFWFGWIRFEMAHTDNRKAAALSHIIVAGEKGLCRAQRYLGEFYSGSANGNEDRSAMAVAWLIKAAGQGDAGANYQLGRHYWNGHGVPEDRNEAFQRFLTAATNGSPPAMFEVGMCFALGRACTRDVEQSLTWLGRAARKGHIGGMLALAGAYAYGDPGTDPWMEALKWRRIAAEFGDALGQQRLAEMLMQPGHPFSNPAEAILWLRKSAEQSKQAKRFLLLSKWYSEPEFGCQDLPKAQEALDRAAALTRTDVVSSEEKSVVSSTPITAPGGPAKGRRRMPAWAWVAVLTAIVAVYALVRWRSSEKLREESVARLAYSQSLAQLPDAADTDMPALLAIESLRRLPTPEGESALYKAMSARTRLEHSLDSGRAEALAWSPDGTRLATSNQSGISIWRVDSGHVETEWKTASPAKALAWSADGRSLASASFSREARTIITTWQVKKPALQKTITIPAPVAGSNGAPSRIPPWRYAYWCGDKLLAIAMGNEVRIVAPEDGRVVGNVNLSPESAADYYPVAWRQGCEELAVGHDHGVRVWRAGSVATARLETRGSIRAVAWRMDGALAVGTHQGSIGVFSPKPRGPSSAPADQRLNDLADIERMLTAPPTSLAFSPTSYQLAFANGTRGFLLEGFRGRQVNLGFTNNRIFAWSPDGTRLATASDVDTTIWRSPEDSRFGERVIAPPPDSHSLWKRTMILSPDEKRLAADSAGGAIRIWDIRRNAVQHTLQGHTADVRALGWSADSKRLASASDDKTVRIWDADRGILQFTLNHTSQAVSVAWSPDGKRLASASYDKTARIWDAASGRLLVTLSHPDKVYLVRWSRDGRFVASICQNHSVSIWDAQTGQRRFTLQTDSTARSLAWSPDSKRIAITASGGPEIWELASGKRIRKCQGYPSNVDWSPAGNLLAGGTAGSVLVWDTESGRLVHQFGEGLGDVRAVSWSPDGRRIFSADYTGTARIWDVDSNSLIRGACAQMDRSLPEWEWVRFLGSNVPYRRTCEDLPNPEE